MHGPSSDSLHALTESLGTAVEGGADASRVGDDLFGVADVLRREASLRRVATDVSVTADAKAQLLRGIFGDRIDPASADLVAQAAGRRWTATRDLPDALEHLGVVAVVRGAEQKGKADELENELFAFERLVSGSPDLRDALSDPARSLEDKRRLVRDLLDGKATSATVRLAEQSLAGTHRTVPLALESYQKVGAVLPAGAPQRRRRPGRDRRGAGQHRRRRHRRHRLQPPRRGTTPARRLTSRTTPPDVRTRQPKEAGKTK
jgi:F-type H+-transporting ATPase subunit delta